MSYIFKFSVPGEYVKQRPRLRGLLLKMLTNTNKNCVCVCVTKKCNRFRNIHINTFVTQSECIFRHYF